MKKICWFLILPLILSLNVSAAYGYEDVYTHSTADSKKIALTFDDGPHCKYTEQILGILEKYGVKATFFVIGRNAEQFPKTVKLIADSGHEIGNHTYSHGKDAVSGYTALNDEMKKTDDIIKGITGKSPSLFRPPEGKCNELIVSCARGHGYRVILWSIDTRDWAHRPAITIARDIMKEVRGGDIILFHDFITPDTPTPEALEKIIPALVERGFEFCTVSEMLCQS